MADDLNKRALLTIDLDVDSLNKDAAEAKAKVSDLTAQLKLLKDSGRENTAEYIALQGQMRSYQQQVTQAVNVNKQLTLAQNVATGSLDEMRAQLSLVTRQYNSLSAEERNNTAVGGALLKQQKQLSDTLKELESAGGNNNRTVGQYREEIEKALGSLNPFQSQLTGVVNAFNSLKVVTAAQAEAQAVASAATEVAAVAQEELAAATAALIIAQEAEAAAQAENIALREAEAATAAQLSVAEEALTAASAELTAALLVQSAAQAEVAATGEVAAAATKTAKEGFNLLDLTLKASLIGAIAGVILLLIGYLKTFDPLVDFLEQQFAGLSAATNFVIAGLKNMFLALTDVGQAFKSVTDFVAHPIDSIKSFGQSMADAAAQARKLKEAEQDLADAMKISEIATADASQKTSALILAARNRSLSVDDRKKLLDEAAALDKADYERRTALANQEMANAVKNAEINGQLNAKQLADLKKYGIAYLIELQNTTDTKGKITDADIDKYKKSQLDIIAIRQESTQRQEKIQNRIDSDAEKAAKAQEAAEAKAQAARDKAAQAKKTQDAADLKANNELTLSQQRTAALTQSGRDSELAAIQIDFQKKIDAAKGYTALILQLQAERDQTLANKRKAFAKQDAADDQALSQLKSQNQIKALTDEAAAIGKANGDLDKDALARQEAALKAAFDLQTQADVDANAAKLANEDLTQLQRAAIDTAYKQQQLDRQAAFNATIDGLETDLTAKRVTRGQAEVAAQAAVQKQKDDIITNGLGVITSVFGKQSVLGKAAFLLQKALAIQEVVVQTQKQVAAIRLATAYQEAAAALTIPFPLSIAAIAGIEAAGAVKTTLAVIGGIVSGAAIAATAIQGFATGGIYNSDGKGGVLSGYSKHDNINARLRSGEGIVVSEAMRNPRARAAVSQINVAYGGKPFSRTNKSAGFADGGVFTPPATLISAGQQDVTQIIQETAAAVASAVPQQVLVIQDVEAGLSDLTYIANKSTI